MIRKGVELLRRVWKHIAVGRTKQHEQHERDKRTLDTRLNNTLNQLQLEWDGLIRKPDGN